MSKKAVLLIRVSTETQDLVQQREKVVDAVKRDGYEDYILIEDKESAVKLSEEERNGLNRLKDAIENDSSIDAVYAYEISRISRKSKVVFSIRDFLIEHHVQLVILNPYFKMLKDDGTLSETSNIFFGIFSSMAENEGFIRSARTKRGKEQAKAKGLHFTGRIPIGYTTNKHHEFEIDVEQAKLVKKIFDMYVYRDMSIRKIAKELNERGIFIHNTFHTTCRVITEIIHREYYTGNIKGYPQIVTQETFDKAQEIKKRKAIDSPRTPVKALCKSILINRDSGHIMGVNTALGSYYSRNSEGLSVRTNIIEPIVWEYTTKIHSAYYSQDIETMVGQFDHDIEVLTNKQHTLEAQIDNYIKSIDRLEERVILGKVRAEVADRMEESINKSIHDEKIRLNNIINKKEQLKHQRENIIDESKKQYDYDSLDLDDRIDMVKKTIEKVVLWREDGKLNIELHNKYNEDTEHITLVRKWRNWVREII